MLLQAIARQFAPTLVGLEPLGNGLINDTYLVNTDAEPLVLQRINRQVFPKPQLIMENLTRLNRHAAAITVNSIDLKIPALLKAGNDQFFVVDENDDYWRAWSYLADTDCLETLSTLSDAEQVGAGLGKFHRLCHDFNTQEFHDTLPGFHITPQYYAYYQQVKTCSQIKEDPVCAGVIEDFSPLINDLEDAKNQGLLTLRVTHGDPKLNNFLFDKHTRKVVSLIDLDTVKPGLIHHDIGDCLRSCCHDQTGDTFNLDICHAVLTGYVKEMRECLTKYDFHYILSAIRLIPFELGLRFYADYLDGDRYFKVAEPRQNLSRAQAQFRLFKDIVAKENDIQCIIAD